MAYLEFRRPEPHDGVDAGGGEQAVGRVRLETVDDRVVTVQHANDVRRLSLPDKERTVVGAGHDILAVTASTCTS